MTEVIKRIQGKRRGGFSLAELLVALVILGVLSALAASAARPILGVTRRNVQRQDARILQSAEEAYLARRQTGAYATVTQLVAERLLRRPSEVSSICLKDGPDSDYFVVKGIPATQGRGDARCRGKAKARDKTDPHLYRASADTRAVP